VTSGYALVFQFSWLEFHSSDSHFLFRLNLESFQHVLLSGWHDLLNSIMLIKSNTCLLKNQDPEVLYLLWLLPGSFTYPSLVSMTSSLLCCSYYLFFNWLWYGFYDPFPMFILILTKACPSFCYLFFMVKFYWLLQLLSTIFASGLNLFTLKVIYSSQDMFLRSISFDSK
jgi:hypothetical protein